MSDLTKGLAEHLAYNGIGVWKITGFYADGDLGIYKRVLPSNPDAIVLSEYAVSDEGGRLTDSVRGIQIRVRRSGRHPDPVEQTGKDIFELLHGARGLTLDGQRVIQIIRQSHAYMGQDSSGNHESVHNYYLNVNIPTPNRTS